MTAVPSGRYFRETVFLLELSGQCQVALKARDRLRSGAMAVHDVHAEHDYDKTGLRPVEILRSAHSFLTHAGIIYRLLYSPSFEAGKALAQKLRRLMEIDSLPALAHAYKLRHDFEHVDERLHEFFRDYETSGQRYHYEGIRTMPGPPGPGRQFVRWIASNPMRIAFNGRMMQVDDIAAEIETVSGRVEPAMAKLPGEYNASPSS